MVTTHAFTLIVDLDDETSDPYEFQEELEAVLSENGHVCRRFELNYAGELEDGSYEYDDDGDTNDDYDSE